MLKKKPTEGTEGTEMAQSTIKRLRLQRVAKESRLRVGVHEISIKHLQ